MNNDNMNPATKDPGSRIKNVRKLLKMKQDDLAAALGVSVPTMCAYEKGITKPSYEFLFNFATKYNVSTEYLVLGKGEPFTRSKDNSDNDDDILRLSDFPPEARKVIRYMLHSEWICNKICITFNEYYSNFGKDIDKQIKSKKVKKE